MGKLKTIIRRGRHYSIERFGISVAFLVVALVVFVSASTGFTMKANAERDAVTSIYTSSFTSRGSGIGGNVRGIYTNEAGTKAALLVQMDDMTNLSIDASKYAIELAGLDGFGYLTGVNANPACGLYVYGNSGYMVFYMVSGNKIPSQRLALNVDMGLTMGSSSSEDVMAHDIWTVEFNPGAEKITKIAALESEKFDPVEFYNQTVVAEAEIEARKVLEQDIKDMRTELSAIIEYQDRVMNDGLELKGMPPVWVDGDKLSVDGEGNIKYEPKTIIDGGLQLDWVGKTIEDGFLADAMEQTGYTDVDEFMNSWKVPTSPTALDLEWKFTDGTVLDDALDNNPNNSRYLKAKADSDALEGAWSAYGITKAHYQGDHLYRLLEIEYESRDVARTYTSTTTDDGAVRVR